MDLSASQGVFGPYEPVLTEAEQTDCPFVTEQLEHSTEVLSLYLDGLGNVSKQTY